jgi:ribosomal protein L40E
MQTGMLWFDADPKRALADKVARAADRYHVKYGQRPTLCYVNEDQLNSGASLQAEVNGVRLAGAPNVLRHHLWIGREEAPPIVEAAPEPPAVPQQAGVLICRRCGAESLDPHARACWACGYRGG